MVFCTASMEDDIVSYKGRLAMRKILLLLVLFYESDAWADMYAALQYVYDTNPVIQAGRSAVDVAAADVKVSATEFQPYVGLSGNAGAARTKIIDDTFDYSPLQYGVEFQQNLFQGGANFARYKGAKGLLIAQQAQLYATQQDVFMDAINAYIEVLNAKQVLELNENNQRVLRQYYEFVYDGQRVGKLTNTDVSQAAARLEMANYYVTDAQAKYENALETFRRIYGDVNCDFVEINLTPVEKLFPQSIISAEDVALRNHPWLQALNAQEDAAKHNIYYSYKSILPSVDVRGSVQKIDDLPYLDDVRDSRIGVYLKMPLYDKGYAFAGAERARASVSEIHDKTINARRVIVENLRMAWNIYQSQYAAINAADASVKANSMALDGIRDEQKRGRRTVLDVLNAEQELLNSRVAYVRARHAQISAYFAILSAMGNLTPENLNLDL